MALEDWTKTLGLDQDLETLVKELRWEVLEEFREEIKSVLRKQIRQLLKEMGLTAEPESESIAPKADVEIEDDIPLKPEITVLSRHISDPVVSAEAKVRVTTLDALQEMFGDRLAPVAEADPLLYTYCFTRENNLDLTGIEGIGGANNCRLMQMDNISAVVSPVCEEEFGQEAIELHLQDLDWVKHKVQVHERVIEQVMLAGPVIPLKFCTIFRGPGRVEEFIGRNYQTLECLINDLQGSEEWGVKLYCHRPTLINTIARTEREEELVGPQGAMYLQRKRLAKQIEEKAGQFLDTASDELFELLKTTAVRWVINEPLSKQVTAREDDMVMNVVFLVPSTKVPEFCRQVETFEATVKSRGMIIEASGPWPPYHFTDFVEAADE